MPPERQGATPVGKTGEAPDDNDNRALIIEPEDGPRVKGRNHDDPDGIDVEQIRAYLPAVMQFGEVHELRIPNTRHREYGTVAGYFDDVEELVNAIREWGPYWAEGVYISLNPVNQALLARYGPNRTEYRATKTAGNANVTRRRNLLIDIDPDRPDGVSATEDERQYALAAKDQIRSFLSDMGFSDPLVDGSSGNGGTLIYRIDLPNDEDSAALVKRVLETLNQRFGSKQAHIDTGTADAARLTKVFGTVAAKGVHSPEIGRVWRTAEGICNPDAEAVPLEALQHVASLYEAPAPGPMASGKFADIRDRLTERGIKFTETQRPYATALRLDRCLTSTEHTDGAAILLFPNGAVDYVCKHSSCGDAKWANVAWKLGYHHQGNNSNTDGSEGSSNATIFQFEKLSEVKRSKPKEWLVEGLLIRKSLNMLYGSGGVGKTYFMVDLTMRLALGWDWHGMALRRTPVAYLACEDGDGVAFRLRGWAERYGVSDEELDEGGYLLRSPVNLRDESQTKALFTALRTAEILPQFIVIDTLAWAMAGGDEDNTQDVMGVMATGQKLVEEFDATVVIVHHDRKDGKGFRGNGHMLNAVYSMLKLEAKDDPAHGKTLSLSADKARAGMKRIPSQFKLEGYRVEYSPEELAERGPVGDGFFDNLDELENRWIAIPRALDPRESDNWEKLTEHDRKLYCLLVGEFGGEPFTASVAKKLGKAAGMGDRTPERCLPRLKRYGYLSQPEERGQYTANLELVDRCSTGSGRRHGGVTVPAASMDGKSPSDEPAPSRAPSATNGGEEPVTTGSPGHTPSGTVIPPSTPTDGESTAPSGVCLPGVDTPDGTTGGGGTKGTGERAFAGKRGSAPEPGAMQKRTRVTRSKPPIHVIE